jgi:hypothetical protein
VQPLTVGPAVEPAEPTTAEPADLPGTASRRRPSTGSQSPPRKTRNLDRRDTLRSLAAEVSAAAAVVDQDDATTAAVLLPPRPTLTLLAPLAEGDVDADAAVLDADDALDFADLRVAASATESHAASAPAPATVDLQGHRDAAAVAPPAEPGSIADAAATAATDSLIEAAGYVSGASVDAAPAADSDVERISMQLEIARAEANVLSAKYDAELAARTAAESRLAAVEEELQFLRAELQMVGETRRKPPGRLRRALRLLPGRRRAVVPAGSNRK